MFVATTGVDRVVERTAQLMREHDTEDIARHGGTPLDVIQKYLNFHYSVSLDLPRRSGRPGRHTCHRSLTMRRQRVEDMSRRVRG